ncbi:hypothetical protein EJ06DRAFT_563714 [Trichodelitschia bisporula]|uniref:Uncharacterized protein n=1 Tax=Trichodelitschia bisporula TaxID=703511 RepID=A0A6G1HTQ0_9PEZI|nr:hypothetical protein EJ06DRAFT_563714 [Trichodelitschia bisporula]
MAVVRLLLLKAVPTLSPVNPPHVREKLTKSPPKDPAGDSRFTSVRTDELRDVQRIFESVGGVKDEAPVMDKKKSSMSLRLTAVFRHGFLSNKSKPKPNLEAEQHHDNVQRTKGEIRKNLLSSDGPELGGYDLDAPIMVYPNENPDAIEASPVRGRKARTRPGIQEVQWPSTLPTATDSPTRDGTFKRHVRRSHSESSIVSMPAVQNLRLPSFIARDSGTDQWKTSVLESMLESMQKGSTSPPVSDIPGPSQPKPALLKDQLKSKERVQTAGVSGYTTENHFRSSLSMEAKRMSLRVGTHDETGDSSNNARPTSSSQQSIHLWNMDISRRLRSDSLSSYRPTRPATPVFPGMSLVMANAGPSLAIPAPCLTIPGSSTADAGPITQVSSREGRTSSSGFASGEVPEEWGNVVRDDSSSVYSNHEPLTSTDSSKLCISQAFPAPAIGPTDGSADALANIPVSAPADIVADTPAETGHNENVTTQEQSNYGGNTAIKTEAQAPGASTSNLSKVSNGSKSSRFKEEFGTLTSRKSRKTDSMFGRFQSKSAKAKRAKESLSTLDGSIDEPRRVQRARALSDHQNATGLMAKAVIKQQNEKSALFLPANKDQAATSSARLRSASIAAPSRAMSVRAGKRPAYDDFPPTDEPRRTVSTQYLKPEFLNPSFSGSEPSQFRDRLSSVTLAPGETAAGPSEWTPSTDGFLKPDRALSERRTSSFRTITTAATLETICSETAEMAADDTEEEVEMGSWSRYPSHTRAKRTGSAGAKDKVEARDFAFDINPANIANDSSSTEGSRTARKKKKKMGPASRSMSMGKSFLKNYARLFRSPSVEFFSHGKGHRSSVSASGKLAHPELEILPPMFAASPIQEHPDDEALDNSNNMEMRRMHRSMSISKLPSNIDGQKEDSSDRPVSIARRAASSPQLVSRSPRNGDIVQWSAHGYESCVGLPRASLRASSGEETPDRSSSSSPVSPETSIGLIDAMLAEHRPSLFNPRVQSTINWPNMTPSDWSLPEEPGKSGDKQGNALYQGEEGVLSTQDLFVTHEDTERERLRCLEMAARLTLK